MPKKETKAAPKGKVSKTTEPAEPTAPTAPTAEPATSAPSTGGYERRTLRWAEIQKNPKLPNHRRDMPQIKDMAASLEENGLQNPLLLWAVPCEPTAMPWGEVTEQYYLVAGHRRYAGMEQLRAAGSTEFDEIPVSLFRGGYLDALLKSVTENVQREDANPLDLGRVFTKILAEENITITELAQRIGKSRPWCSFVVQLHQGDDKIAPQLVKAVKDSVINHWVAVSISRQPKEDQIEIVRRLRNAMKEGKVKEETAKVKEELAKKRVGKRKIRSVSELRETLDRYILMDKTKCDREQLAHISGIMKGVFWALNNEPDMGEINPEQWFPGYQDTVERLTALAAKA